MKKILKYAAALAAILPVSCEKEMTAPQGDALEGNTVKVIMNATAEDPASKVLLNGNLLSWEVGDELKCRWGNASAYGGSLACDVLSAASAGTGAMFTGEFDADYFPGVDSQGALNQHLYVHYSTDGQFTSANGIQYRKDLSSEQTGKKADLKNHLSFSSWVTKTMMTYDATEETVSFDAEMMPHFAILKMSVPVELGVKSISLEAESYIAGRIQIYPARKPGQNGGIGSSALVYRPTGTDIPQSNIINVSDDGNVISGDVYVVVLPDAYDTEAGTASYANYYCSTEKLKITIAGDNGSAVFEKTLKDKIHCGDIKDMGTFPVTSFSALTIKSSDSDSMTMAVNGSNDKCSYYYEVGATEEDCADPTIDSDSFDPEEGFELAMTSETFVDKYFVKVLVCCDNEKHNRVIKGSVRLWSFRTGNDAGVKLADAYAGNSLLNKYDEVATNNGLTLRRMQGYEEKDLKFGQTAARIELVTAKVALYMTAEHNSNAVMYFCVDQKTCLGTSLRTFNLYCNNSRINSYNGFTTRYQINGSLIESSGRRPIVWNLGELNAGDMVAPCGDGQHVLYDMALLEVL